MTHILLTLAVLIQVPNDQRAMRIAKLSKIARDDDSWSMRSLALIGLSQIRHPDAAVAVLKTLTEVKEARVRIYAAASLARFDGAVLRSAFTAEHLDRLIKKDLKSKKAYYRGRIAAALYKAFNPGEFRTPRQWADWWKEASKTYAPKPFKDSGGRRSTPTGTGTAVRLKKLIDLQKDGLDLVLLLDQTGSMRMVIDDAKKGLEEIATIMREIVPKLRLALITYDDQSHVRTGLTTDYKSVVKKLGTIIAQGGADFPEGVDKAITASLKDRRMVWRARAAKVVIVVGDAPMHDADKEDCLELITKAHKEPDKLVGKRKVGTGGKKKRKGTVRPWIFNTIRTGRAPMTQRNFEEIARAGGGTAVMLTDSGEVTRQILLLTFGEEWKKELEIFISIYRAAVKSK